MILLIMHVHVVLGIIYKTITKADSRDEFPTILNFKNFCSTSETNPPKASTPIAVQPLFVKRSPYTNNAFGHFGVFLIVFEGLLTVREKNTKILEKATQRNIFIYYIFIF